MKMTLGDLIGSAQISAEMLQETFDLMEQEHSGVLLRNPDLYAEYTDIRASLRNFDRFAVDIQVHESMRAAEFMRKFRFLCETLFEKKPELVH